MYRPDTDLRAALAARPERFQVAPQLLAARLAAASRSIEPSRFSLFSHLPAGTTPDAVLERLRALRLSGMADAFSRMDGDDHDGMAHTDWLMRLLDGEAAEREQRRARLRLRSARLRYSVSVENVDCSAARGLDRAQFQIFANGPWIDNGANLIVEGATGTGKTWLACALGHKACLDGRQVLYQRATRLFSDLAIARGTARYKRLLRQLGDLDLLILDDWGLRPLSDEQRHDMMEIVEERCDRKSTVIVSQAPVERWADLIGEPALAAMMLDRFVPYAHRVQLKGDSRRSPRRAAT